ncbi:MAG: hypothetical protein ACKOAU_07805, partial [Pirellula sp.]
MQLMKTKVFTAMQASKLVKICLIFLVSWVSTGATGLAFQAPEQPTSRYREPGFPKERIPMWKKFEEAVNQGLPKTAIETLDQIIQQALNEKAYPEAALALAHKIRLESEIQGG